MYATYNISSFLAFSLMSIPSGTMQPKIPYELVDRVSRLSRMPVSRGFSRALAFVLEDYEKLLEQSKNLTKNGLSKKNSTRPTSDHSSTGDHTV